MMFWFMYVMLHYMLESFLLVCGISTVQENINNCNNYLHYLLRREHSVYTKCTVKPLNLLNWNKSFIGLFEG
jgi:hypothetical protein